MDHSPHSLGHSLHFVSFSLSRQPHCGDQLLLLPHDLLLLNLNLLPSLYNLFLAIYEKIVSHSEMLYLDLNFLISYSLLDFSCLKFIGHLSFCFL